MQLILESENIFVVSMIRNLIWLSYFKKIPFLKIKEDILGSKFDLTITLIGKEKIRSLNNKYRKIDKATDVLSFNLEKNVGEIFICPEISKIKSKKFDMKVNEYLLFLVIHAMLHLKGFEHNSKMERYEFTYYNRYRHRHL